jgi:hypothetical protein
VREFAAEKSTKKPRVQRPGRASAFDIAAATGAPPIETDFPNEVTRTAQQVLPQPRRPVGVTR